jgi:hypothetical protein
MRRLLSLAAGAEAATGLVLLIYPPIVGRLLLNAEFSGSAVVLGRVCGIGLLSLGLACWPRNTEEKLAMTFWAMLIYSLLCAVYLLYLGVGRQWAGLLLWPAVVWHGVITFLLARVWLKIRKDVVHE